MATDWLTGVRDLGTILAVLGYPLGTLLLYRFVTGPMDLLKRDVIDNKEKISELTQDVSSNTAQIDNMNSRRMAEKAEIEETKRNLFELRVKHDKLHDSFYEGEKLYSERFHAFDKRISFLEFDKGSKDER